MERHPVFDGDGLGARRADGASEPPLAEPVSRFLTALHRLPLRAWIDAAVTDPQGERPIPVAPTPAAADAPQAAAEAEEAAPGLPADPDVVARHHLREIVERLPGAVRVRRRIDTIASVADGFAHPAVTLRMTRIARTAAFALLAREQLGDDEFRRLYRPFAHIIPLDEIGS